MTSPAVSKSYDERYSHVYNAMKRAGHTAITALTIVVQAKRGDRYALNWIKAVRRLK